MENIRAASMTTGKIRYAMNVCKLKKMKKRRMKLNINGKPKKPTIEESILTLLESRDLTTREIAGCTDFEYTSITGTLARLLRSGKIEHYEFKNNDLDKKLQRKYRLSQALDKQNRDVKSPNQKTVKKWCGMQVSETALFWAWALFDRSKINVIFNREITPC